jgi:hypothetical protein
MNISLQELYQMTISPPEREAKSNKIVVDRDPVETSFEKMGEGAFLTCSSKVRQQQLDLESPR